MHTTKEELEETYRRLSEEDIAGLYAEMNTLTDEARSALQAEVQRRGIRVAKLRHLKTAERQRENKFDRLEGEHEKKVAGYVLNRVLDREFWTAVLLLIGLISLVLSAVTSRRH